MSVNEKLTAIADAIRAKTGGTDALTLDRMAEEIAGIGSGGGSDHLAARLENTLTEYSADISEIASYGFYGCTSLASVRFPNVTTINTYAFFNCGITEVTDENFPALTRVGQRAFRNCTAMKKFVKPNTEMAMGGIGFEACSALRVVDVWGASYVEGNQNLLFYGCTALEAFIIRRTDAVNGWLAISMFQGSGVANGIGYIYVPSALVEAYKAATGWADWAEQIRAIEDYPDITGG